METIIVNKNQQFIAVMNIVRYGQLIDYADVFDPSDREQINIMFSTILNQNHEKQIIRFLYASIRFRIETKQYSNDYNDDYGHYIIYSYYINNINVLTLA